MTPSIVDAERQLAIAVIAITFTDLRLKVRARTPEEKGKDKISDEVHVNRLIRNQAILFLTSGPDRAEWYYSRLYWAMAAGYCPDKIRTKALAICRENNIRIVHVGDDVNAPGFSQLIVPENHGMAVSLAIARKRKAAGLTLTKKQAAVLLAY